MQKQYIDRVVDVPVVMLIPSLNVVCVFTLRDEASKLEEVAVEASKGPTEVCGQISCTRCSHLEIWTVSGSHLPSVPATVHGDFWKKSTYFLVNVLALLALGSLNVSSTSSSYGGKGVGERVFCGLRPVGR